MRSSRTVLSFLLAAALLAGCPRKAEDPCSNDDQKASVLALAQDWYLFPELLPAQVDLAAYAGPAELLDALTANARAANRDRYWSYTTTSAAQQSFFAEGTSVGFGIGLLVRETNRLFVSQVYPGSAAAGAQFLRGDEILGIGETPDTIVPVADLIAGETLSQAIGPPTAGLTRTFEVTPRGGGTSPPRTMTKGTFGLDPVPQWPIFDLTAQGGPKVGYVPLRTFIAPADARLRLAFGEFQAQGVTDVIVDLRYNGGGLVSTAELLANLLGGGLGGSVMFRLQNNARHAGSDFIDTFVPESVSLAPTRTAFLVTGASASASELVPNVLEPFRQRPLALVGRQTYGKPVGQRGFTHSECDLVVYLVSFRLANSEGDGDYFGGLPATGFSGCAIRAEDDLLHDTWDRAETQTAAALEWLTTGTCPPPPVGPLAAIPADTSPESLQPSEAQRHVRGLF